MTKPFSQNTLAMVWDFDKTLISTYMQEPLFKRYGIDSANFWREVNALPEFYAARGVRVNHDAIYLNHILTYVRSGKLAGLSNRILRECGAELEFYDGLPSCFDALRELVEANEKFKAFDIRLEHYVVSTGFAETIRGSKIAPHVDGIFGCEFIETPAEPGFSGTEPNEEAEISQIAMALDNTSKTRFLFEINKGSNKYPDQIDVNATIAPENRRIPFENMVYIADGPSDVPAFSILNAHGGSTFAIYPKGDLKAFRQVEQLRNDRRIQMFGEADYTQNSLSWMWLSNWATNAAERIRKRHEDSIKNSSSAPPGHLNS